MAEVLLDFVHDVNGTVGYGARTRGQTWDQYKRSQKETTRSPYIAKHYKRYVVRKRQPDYLQPAEVTAEVYPLEIQQEERGITFILI